MNRFTFIGKTPPEPEPKPRTLPTYYCACEVCDTKLTPERAEYCERMLGYRYYCGSCAREEAAKIRRVLEFEDPIEILAGVR